MVTKNLFRAVFFVATLIEGCSAMQGKEAYLLRTAEFVEQLNNSDFECNTQGAKNFLKQKLSSIDLNSNPINPPIFGKSLQKLKLPITNVIHNLKDLSYTEISHIDLASLQPIESSMASILKKLSDTEFFDLENPQSDILIILDYEAKRLSFNNVEFNNIQPGLFVYNQEESDYWDCDYKCIGLLISIVITQCILTVVGIV